MRINPVTEAWQVLVLLGVSAALAALAFVLIGPVAIIVLPVVLLIGGANVVRAHRHNSAIVLGYLEQAVRTNSPLPQMMQAAAAGEKLGVRRSLIRLAHALGGGMTIADALERGVGYVPRRWVGLLGAAERVGHLQLILGYVTEQTNRRLRPNDPNNSLPLGAIALEVAFLALAVAGALVIASLIAPQFAEMLNDYDTAMPAPTQWLIDLNVQTEVWLGVAGLLLWLVVIAGFVGLAPILFASSRHGGDKSEDRRAAMFSWLTLGWWTRDRALADACLVIAASLDAGLPLHSAVREAASLRFNGVLRGRLLRWARGLEGGQGAPEAARHAGMHHAIVSLLGAAQASGNMPQTFRFLHRHFAHRFSRFVTMISGAAGPVCILLIGLVVGWIVLALMLPLSAMMEAALQQTGLS